jgi:DNA-directed RNA polymerase subunit RPC12/RpoP
MMARQRIHRSRGAVLAEVIMVGVVGSLLLSVLPGFYLGYIKLWQRETARLGSVQQADFAVRRMQEDIRNARNLVISSDGSSITVVLPKRSYDATLGRMVNVLDSNGSLINGDQVQYYYTPNTAGSAGGAIYRRVIRLDGIERPARLVSTGIYPALNPRYSLTSSPIPVFTYDGTLRAVTVTMTAAVPKPSTGTFASGQVDPKCRRCGSNLVRVATEQHPEGETRCPYCGLSVKPNVEIATYQTELSLRNR